MYCPLAERKCVISLRDCHTGSKGAVAQNISIRTGKRQ